MNLNRQTRAWRRYFEAYDRAMQEWPSDRHSETISTPAGATQVYSCGVADGDPVILLHGGDATSASWHFLAGALGAKFRIIALDIIVDLGRSVPSRDHRTPDDLVDWLCGVMDALDIERGHLVGESMGGWLCMEMALRRPERVRRVGLLAPASVFASIALGFWLRVLPAALLPLPTVSRMALNRIRAVPSDLQHPLHELLVRGLYIRRGRARRPSPRVFEDDELSRIQPSVLLLYGRQEVLTDPVKAIARAERFVPNLVGRTINGAGHALSDERPAAVAQQLLDFLA